MVKKFIPLFFPLFIAVCTVAQVPPRGGTGKTDGGTGGGGTGGHYIPTTSVNVQANHDFYLTVGDTRYPYKILKNNPKELKLVVGKVQKLLFEEADSTGEIIQRFIRVTSEMMKQSDSVITVTFKNDYLDIIQPGASTTIKREEENTALREEAKEKALATELLADMVLKEGGIFNMGSRSGQKGGAPRRVTIRSMKVGRHEITQRQWQALMGANGSINKDCADCPVENTSWNDAALFVEKLNKASGKKFRLPTEAEWEYVADKIIKEEAGGISVDQDVINQIIKTVLDSSAWYNEKATHSVGQKRAAAGVHDLFGNVAEWCADEGSQESAADKKVYKGGSYKDKKEDFRISLRGTAAPSEKQKTVGFRLVMDAD